MTAIKKPTNINKRTRGIGKLYRSFEDDIWGRFIYKNLYFKTRYQFLFSQMEIRKEVSPVGVYKNMHKL